MNPNLPASLSIQINKRYRFDGYRY